MMAKPMKTLELHYPMIQFFIKLYIYCICVCLPSMLIGNMTNLQAILGGTLRAPGIHGEIEIKVSESF